MKYLCLSLLVMAYGEWLMAQNYSFPVGHQEGFLGNSGGAMMASPGNVLLNPAGLGFYELENLKISVSGNALTSETYDLGDLGTEKEVGSARPTFVAGMFKLGSGRAAVFASEPSSMAIETNIDQKVGEAKATGAVRAVSRQWIMGMTWAKKIDDGTSWGLSMGLSQREAHQYSIINILGVDSAQSSFNQFDSKTKSLFVSPGYLWHPTEKWTMALSGALNPLALESKATEYVTESNSTAPAAITEKTTHFDPKGWKSNSIKIANALKANERDTLFVDTSYQGAVKAKVAGGSEVTKTGFWVWSLGWKRTVNASTDLMMGYSNGQYESAQSRLFTIGSMKRIHGSQIAYGAFYFDTPHAEGGVKVAGLMASSDLSLD